MRFYKLFTRTYTSRVQKSFMPLQKRHEAFLDLIKNHAGSGSVKFQRSVAGDPKICQLTFSNPQKRGAVSAPMIQQLASALDSLLIEDSKSLHERPVCLILRGDGKYFCSGLDFSLAQDVINTPQRGGLMLDFMTDALNRIRQSDMISVCLVNGPALGGGSELVTCCDYRLIASDSYIQFVHAKLGAAPGWGGAHRLFNIVGRRHALRYLGSSQRIDPAEALTVGLCDEIIPVTATAAATAAAADADSNLVNNSPSGDDDSLNKTLQDAALRFLEPFSDQKYPKSVHAIKGVIASGECPQNRDEELEEELTLAMGVGIAGDETATSHMQQIEREAFLGRWFCSDNLEAIAKATSKAPKSEEK